MKTMLLLLILPLIAFAQDIQPDMKWVDDEVAAIKPPRKGVPPKDLIGLKDPFRAELILNQPKGKGGVVTFRKPKAHHLFTLEAVMNNRSAMIDGKWYKKDEKVYGYTVQSIDKDSVLLQNKKKQIKLSLIKYNKNIKINAK